MWGKIAIGDARRFSIPNPFLGLRTMGVLGAGGLKSTPNTGAFSMAKRKCGGCKTPPKGPKTEPVKPYKRRKRRKCKG